MPNLSVLRGDCLARLGRNDEAVVHFERALPALEDDRARNCRSLIALSLKALGRYEEASAIYYELVAEADPRESVTFELNLAGVLHEAGDSRRALARLQRLSLRAPELPELWGLMGTVAWALGDYEAAERALRNAVARAPHRSSYRLSLGVLLVVVLGRVGEGVQVLDAAARQGHLDARGVALRAATSSSGSGRWPKSCEDR